MSVCGNGEMLGDGTAALKLPTNRPLYFVRDRLPGYSVEYIAGWIAEAFASWGKVCNLVARRIMSEQEAGPDDVVCLVTVDDLGSSGVLADQVLPYPGGKVLRMRINNRITWKRSDGVMSGGIDPLRCLTHELGHFLGLSHLPVGPPPDLMEPSIRNDVIGPQSTEAKIVAGWFGPPLTLPTPPPLVKRKLVIEFDGAIPGVKTVGVE